MWAKVLRERGRLWTAIPLSTCLVDYFVDASWRPWIARCVYPQPSTSHGDAIPHLPRTHPHLRLRRWHCLWYKRCEFMGITDGRADAWSTYPHYPPPLLLSAAISLINNENRSKDTDHISRSHDLYKDIHSRAGTAANKTARSCTRSGSYVFPTAFQTARRPGSGRPVFVGEGRRL
jgi:hypothetical protein